MSTSTTGGGAGEGAAGGAGGGIGGTGGTGGSTDPGTGGGGPGDCPLLSALELSSPSVKDTGGDGTWSPGEDATVSAIMTNPTDTDVQYPGITWSSSEPLVAAPAPYNAFFVLFAGASMPIEVGFVADAATPKGTKAVLTGTLTDIQGNVCDALPAVTIEVTIE